MSSPNGSDEPVEAPPQTEKPLLASEALMDEIAPVEPWAGAARLWCGTAGALFAALSLAPLWGGRSIGAPAACLVLATAAVAIAAAPVNYATRAALMAMVGAASGVLGVASLGPAAAVGRAVGWLAILHLVTATGLSAALLFRARYRAYSGARYVLVAALGATLPFVGYCILMLTRGDIELQVASGIALTAVGFSLLGFMGSETNVAGSWVAVAVVFTVAAELGAETTLTLWSKLSSAEPWWALGSVAAFALSCALAALGMFQILATRYGAEARSVDFGSGSGKRAQLPSITDSWSTRQ